MIFKPQKGFRYYLYKHLQANQDEEMETMKFVIIIYIEW